jgi:kumamolisin
MAAAAPAAHAADASAARIGAVPAGTALQIVLPLHVDAAGLRRFALAVSNPDSPLYGRYESIATLAHRFGASPRTRARVLDYLSSHGASDARVDATGLLAEATVTAGLAGRLFETPLSRFRAVDGASFIAPASTPALPAGLRGLVDGVIGLNTRPLAAPSRLLRSRFGRQVSAARAPGARAAASQPPSVLPRTGTPAGCANGVSAGEVNGDPSTAGFTPNQYLTAYDVAPLRNAGAAGQGERVALIEIDGFTPSDINTFASCFGLRVPAINVFGVGSVSQLLPPGGESTLDLEVLDATAPGLNAIDVYESRSDAPDVLKALVAPFQVPGHKPQVVSASLGLCEENQFGAVGASGIAAAERALSVATASGVSFLASSGDNGSADCVGSDGVPLDKLAVHYPASSWWVTGVGGTNLQLSPANQITSQIVWNDTTKQIAAGGGGLSGLFNRPYYQSGVVSPNARGVPDVSMLADLVPGYAIYCSAVGDCVNTGNIDPWQTVGGTSAATPLLAGGVALVDQSLRLLGRQDVGFLNPLLYHLGRSSMRGSVFYDVTAIGNDVGPYLPTSGGRALGCCTARSGYDEASGWGSVDLTHFAQQAFKLVPYILGKISLSLPGHQRPVAHDHILASVVCSKPSYAAAFASVKIGRGKPFEVDSEIYNLPKGGHQTIPIVFSARQLGALRSALTKHEGVTATVYGVIADPLGNVQLQTRGRQLKITA